MCKFHDYSLIRMFQKDASQIIDHIKVLPKNDQYLRFGYSIKEEQIEFYVDNSLEDTVLQKNFWWGIYDEEKLVATIHVAISDDVAEFAFTTDVNYRGQKLGQLLFARGFQCVCERQITRIYMACLSENIAIRKIASKFGLSVMTYGPDAEASVTIQYPVPLSRLNEVKMCIIDKSIGK